MFKKHSDISGMTSAFHIFEGICDGLSHFSGMSRVATIYAIRPNDAMRIYDPQSLLRGHEPKLKELYIDSEKWRKIRRVTKKMSPFSPPIIETNLPLTGLISCGGRSKSMFYQMWFTEQHPDMCSTGPTHCWLEHAVLLLSQDMSRIESNFSDSSGYAIREYAPHAVRDFLVDELNRLMGMDIQLHVYPILYAVLEISKTMEEGYWPRGELVFVMPAAIPQVNFITRFPTQERPPLTRYKHVRKLLKAVEHSQRKLISDGRSIVGIAEGTLPDIRLAAEFCGGHGFLKLNQDLVCSFYDGNFHSSTRKAKLVQLEEILLETELPSPFSPNELFKIVAQIVHHAENKRIGCTLVIDLNVPPLSLAGQHMETPLDLCQTKQLDLSQALAALDGALHISFDLRLLGFACILDGRAIDGEDRSRGARYNSALRFTAEHEQIVVIVVSSDRPVSILQQGIELSGLYDYAPIPARLPHPPTLDNWLQVG